MEQLRTGGWGPTSSFQPSRHRGCIQTICVHQTRFELAIWYPSMSTNAMGVGLRQLTTVLSPFSTRPTSANSCIKFSKRQNVSCAIRAKNNLQSANLRSGSFGKPSCRSIPHYACSTSSLHFRRAHCCPVQCLQTWWRRCMQLLWLLWPKLWLQLTPAFSVALPGLWWNARSWIGNTWPSTVSQTAPTCHWLLLCGSDWKADSSGKWGNLCKPTQAWLTSLPRSIVVTAVTPKERW